MTLLFASGTFASGIINAQSSKRDDAQIPIVKALRDVSKIYDTKFVYEKSLLEGKTTSFTIKDIKRGKKVEEVLKSILYPKNLVFLYIKDNYYTIVSRDRMEQQHSYLVKNNTDKNTVEAQLTSPAIENLHSESKLIEARVIAHIVRGLVTNSEGEPLAGVSITVKGTGIGTSSDSKGNYSIDAPEDGTLVFSFVGFNTTEIVVGNRRTINVTLETTSLRLEDVVVNVGYGTQRKVTLTGSVASINSKDLQSNPVTNIGNSLAGLLPGLMSKNTTGQPGKDDPIVFIRGSSTTGNNSPLVVVDGVQGVSGWQRINPNDIESISVLKDASAAIYGARAANGVILITTKRGTTGKPTISYSANFGFSQPTRLPKLADAATLAGYINDLLVMQGQSIRYTEDEIQKFKDGTDPNYPNNNWYKDVLKPTTPQSQHYLNIRGGTEAIKYSVSGSFSNENGIFKKDVTNFKVYSIRSNLDAKVNKYLKVGFDLNNSFQNGNYARADFNLLRQVPFYPVYWPNGLPSAGVEGGQNPAIEATSAWGNDNNKVEQTAVKASFDLVIPWVKGLGVDGYFAYNKDETKRKLWQTPFTVYNYDKVNDAYIPVTGGGILRPQLTQSLNNGKNTLYNLRIKYEKQFNDHHLSTFVAMEQSESISNSFSAFRKNYLSSSIDELFAGSLIDQNTDGTSVESSRENFFGRISYGFKEKYLVDFNFRYDGSSNFPKGNQWGFFPGASVAWRISEENFMKKNPGAITNMKLRASYGQIGNDAIAAFQNLRLYTLNSRGYTYGTTQSATQGLVAGVSPNPNITWEVLKTENIGFDADFWNGMLGMSLDIFKQKRSNILATRDLAVPSYTGLILPAENIGIVENKGFELLLSHANRINDELTYKIEGNVAYAKSKVIDLSEPQNVPEWQKAKGHILGADLMYEAMGIYRTEEELNASPHWPGAKVGDLIYKDVNGNATIDAGDRVRTDKTNTPEVTFGLNFSLNYKNFSLWTNFAGAANVWQYYVMDFRISLNSLAEILKNRYVTGSMDSKYPILPTVSTESEPSGLHSTFWMRDASYVRLKTLELSYTLPETVLSKIKVLNSVRIYVNGNNLFTLDKLKWVDPENINPTGSFYPQSKIYNLGLNVSF
jgi:TonB-linked SusC/RagA family outer membrane protein